MNSALYPCTITHVRTAPRRYALRHRTYLWLIDPDRPPELPALLRPLAASTPVTTSAARRPPSAPVSNGSCAAGVDLADGTVTMLTQARVLGHVFNP